MYVFTLRALVGVVPVSEIVDELVDRVDRVKVIHLVVDDEIRFVFAEMQFMHILLGHRVGSITVIFTAITGYYKLSILCYVPDRG